MLYHTIKWPTICRHNYILFKKSFLTFFAHIYTGGVIYMTENLKLYYCWNH